MKNRPGMRRTKKEISNLKRGREKFPRAKFPWVYVAAEKYGTTPETIKKERNAGFGALKQFIKDQIIRQRLGLRANHYLLRIGNFVGSYEMLVERSGLTISTLKRYLNEYRRGKRSLDDLLLTKEERYRLRVDTRTRGDWNLGQMAPRKLPEDIKQGSFEQQWLDSHRDYRDYEEIKRNDSFIKREDRPKQNLGVEPHRSYLPIERVDFSL